MGKVILVGPSASGKDYARRIFENKGFKLGVSYTTRSPRSGEVDGVDYNFITKEMFINMIRRDAWIEYDQVTNMLDDGTTTVDYYGTTKEQFEKFDLFIMTPSGVRQIPEEYKNQFILIGFDVDMHTRIERMSEKRGWSESKIQTRIDWETKEFSNFKVDIKIKNPDF